MPLLPSRTSYSVAWTLLLLFIAWPLSYFSASWWIFFLPFEERYECIREVQEFLENLMKWPRKVGHAIITSSCHFPRPGPDPIESLLATANPCFAFVDPMTISTTTTTATTSTDANPNESKNTSIWCGNN